MFSIEISTDLEIWTTIENFASYELTKALAFYTKEKKKIKPKQMKAVRLIVRLEQYKGHGCTGCHMYRGEGVDCGGNGC